jgi:lipoate-protein ligase A
VTGTAGVPAVPAAPPGWHVTVRSGSAAELHALDPPPAPVRQVWVLEPTRPALVLGSTQPDDVADHEALAARGIELAHRRSGGGVVLVGPGLGLWVDVLVPRGDPLWDDDVTASFSWLGRAWREALAELGFAAEVHEGRPEGGPYHRLVCIAGVGAGEVVLDGRKVVGLSQRRTRWGARFQAIVYTAGVDVRAVADLVAPWGGPADGGREALAGWLGERAAALPVASLDLLRAFLAALPPAG